MDAIVKVDFLLGAVILLEGWAVFLAGTAWRIATERRVMALQHRTIT